MSSCARVKSFSRLSKWAASSSMFFLPASSVVWVGSSDNAAEKSARAFFNFFSDFAKSAIAIPLQTKPATNATASSAIAAKNTGNFLKYCIK